MTIINPHNMQRLYLTWAGLLISVAGLGWVQYVYGVAVVPLLRPEYFFRSLVISLSIGGVAGIMAIVFKFFFRREFIAWNFAELIAVAGVTMTVLTGWQWYWLVFPGVAFLLLVILGPYLHFE